MADPSEELRNFVYAVAWRMRKSHPGYFHASSGALNRSEIARELGVSEARLSRIAWGKTSPADDFWDKLKEWSGHTSRSDMWAEKEAAPPYPLEGWSRNKL